MKKLMITAAAAAMVSGAFAINEAQVYDFTASLKTTGCTEGKVSKAMANYVQHNNFGWSVLRGTLEQGDKIVLRKQRSVKIAGVIWGCDCPTIADPRWRPLGFDRRRGIVGQYLGGYLFWNQTRDELYDPRPDGNGGWMTSFRWQVLNRIDALTKCEGTFQLFSKGFDQGIYLIGSGFGKIKGSGCDTYITSISGSLAGTRSAPWDEFGCILCAANGCLVAPICDTCWDRDTTALSIAYGSWSIKFNSKMAKRISQTPYISRVYNFKKAGIAREYMNFVESVWEWNARNNPAADADEEVLDPTEYTDEKSVPETYVLTHEEAEDVDLEAAIEALAEAIEEGDAQATGIYKLFPIDEYSAMTGEDDIDEEFVAQVLGDLS